MVIDLADMFMVAKDIGVPVGLFLLGWIKTSQSKHSESVNEKLDSIGKNVNDLQTRVAVLEAIGKLRPASFLPPGKTLNELE